MNYNEALDYIHSFLKFGSKPGLERVTELLERNDNPQNSLRIIHVAGTNGKGTVSTMLSNILKQDNKKTALFTSPYVIDFCERMKIDGNMISHEELSMLTQKYSKQIEKLNEEGIFPTEFELITAMAFDYFRKNNCQYAVVEVGLGGLYDSTNVVKSPEATVITHIDYDHEEVLGDTIEEITLQKCGIIKDGCPCVVYPTQYDKAFDIIKEECKKKNSELKIVSNDDLKVISSDTFSSKVSYKGNVFEVKLSGYHQVLNAVTAYETAKVLGIDDEKIIKGIEETTMAARVEVINKNPLVILDGAHNPDGAKALRESLKDIGEYVAVVSMMKDKDVEKAIPYLLSNAKKTVVTKCSNIRAMETEQLRHICKKYCDDVLAENDVRKAIDKALSMSNNMPVVVCGSLYFAGDIRGYLKNIFS